MAGVVRKGDACTGHGCFPSRPNIGASANVFVNALGVHRVGDPWAIHCCPDNGCHGGSTASGSPTIFVNGKPMARKGDPVDCGSKCMVCSSNVFAN